MASLASLVAGQPREPGPRRRPLACRAAVRVPGSEKRGEDGPGSNAGRRARAAVSEERRWEANLGNWEMVTRDGACRPLRELAQRFFPFEFVSFLIGQRQTSPAGEAVAGPHPLPAAPPHPGVGTRRRERSGPAAQRPPPSSAVPGSVT